MSALDAERWRQLRSLFEDLAELPPGEREERLTGLDAELADEARALLAAGDGRGSHQLEEVVAAGAASLLSSLGDGGASATADGEARPGLELGSWRLVQPLGQGGTAEVWEACRVDGQFEQTVAVKLLKRGMNSADLVRRFVRERQILADLDHPGIARLFDGGLAPDGRPYLVMERVEGKPITAWCVARGLDVPARLRLIVACCEAVAAAHRQLVVHRDLKPSNILVTVNGQVKLLDFGIAKLLARELSSEVTNSEVRVLTPSYAAPEQILGDPISTATDVYALGVLAYELLVGRLPHRRRGRRGASLVAAVVEETVTRPSTAVLETERAEVEEEQALPPEPRARQRLARSLAGDLDTIVMTALQRQPERRYASVDALAEDLQRFLAGRTIRARPDTLGYRARKFVGRHRLTVGLGTVAALSLFAALGVALWQGGRAREAAAAARVAAASAREEATKSAAIATFLTDVFTAADPEGKQAADLTARELVQRGAAQVDRQLAQQPSTRAALQHVLGVVQYRLGLYEPARELLEKALAERRGLSPPAPADVAASAAALGEVYHRQGDSAKGLPLLEEAVAYRESAGSASTLDLVRNLNTVANIYKALHRDDEARAAFERAIALLDRQPDADPSLFARVLNNYGLFLDRSLRQQAAARVALERALALHERSSGPDSALVAGTLGNLSEIYIRLGELERAVAASRRALGIAEKRYGPQHYETGIALNGLAWALLWADRDAEAVPLLERSLTVLRGAVGDEHRTVGYSYRNLGEALAATGHPTAAVEALRRAERVWQAALGSDAPELGSVYVLLAPLLAADGDAEAGERLLVRTVELWQVPGNYRFKLGEAWVALAQARLARCRPAGAREAIGGAKAEAVTYPDAKWVSAIPQLELAAANSRCAVSP